VSANWDVVTIGDTCDILDSQRKPVTKADRVHGEIPYYGASGILDFVKDYIFDEKLVLLGEDGAKWGPGDRSAFIIEGKTWVNNHAHVLRPNREILLDEWLTYFLVGSDLSDFISGVTVPKLNQGKMREIQFPLPPLDEQKRIVAKLAYVLEALEQAKISQTRKGIEIRSLYYLEFEKLMRRNEDNWPSVSIGESCEYLNGKAHEPFVTDDGEYRLVTSKFVSTNGMISRNVSRCLSPLNEGDVTFVLSDLPNGKALAKAYLVGKDEKLALNQRVMRIRSDKFDPEFLYLQINRHPELLSYDNGESQTHLKLKQILDCQLFCPEIELQRKVAKRLLSFKDLVKAHDQNVASKLVEIESLKKRFLSLAFSGDF
jgi:type I restriction enzyme S subunit